MKQNKRKMDMQKKCYQSPCIFEMKVDAQKLMVPSLNVSSGSGLNPTIQPGTGQPGGGGAPRSRKLGFGDKGEAWDNWED